MPWFVPADLRDLFWHAGYDRPELYFDPEFRFGISAFREHCPDEELYTGLERLRTDLDTGHWYVLRRAADTSGSDYCFFVADSV